MLRRVELFGIFAVLSHLMSDGRRGKTGCVRTTKGINYFLHIMWGDN